MTASMMRDFLPMRSDASFQHARKDVLHSISKRPAVRTGRVGWSFVAAAFAVTAAIMFAGYASFYRPASSATKGATYQTASAPATGRIVAVRFVAQASAADIDHFLRTYQASMVEAATTDGSYRIRISDGPHPQDELAHVVARMGQEKIVDFIAVRQ